MTSRLASLLVVLLVIACSSPRSNKGSPDAQPPPDSADDVGSTCPTGLMGNWTMTSTFCGSTDVTQDIKTQGGIAQMLLVVSNTGDSCRIAITYSGPTCTETEEVGLVANLDGSFTQTPTVGITGCQPAACTFNANDAPCAIGDRGQPNTLTSVKLDGGNFVVTSQPPAGLCGGYGIATVVTYVKS